MTPPSAINTLIELATNETDEAAKRLGQAIGAKDEAGKKLAVLLQYRKDYAARFQSTLATGMNAQDYRNFQLFLEKLDTAITGQQRIVETAQKRIADERATWQASERKRMSYNTLANRAQQEVRRKENQLDQKQTDEHAARLAQSKR